MTTERNAQGVDGLAEVMGLLRKATPGPWRVGGSLIAADAGLIVSQAAAYDAAPNDLAAIVAAVNYLRSHGEAIRELVGAARNMVAARNAATIGARNRLRAALAKFPEPRP